MHALLPVSAVVLALMALSGCDKLKPGTNLHKSAETAAAPTPAEPAPVPIAPAADDGHDAARDAQRATDAKLIREALDKYKAAKGKYPSPYGDNAITDLGPDLVSGGFLSAIPDDPLWARTANQYRYVSPTGAAYGIMFHIEQAAGAIPAGGPCLIGEGTKGTGWYNEPPACPF